MALKIDIAETEDERIACYRLRYDVNVAEGRSGGFMCHEKRQVVDELDAAADIHYVSDGGRMVGSARSIYFGNLVPPVYARYFGVETLQDLPRAQMNAVSRLVVDPAYRKSAVLPSLLASTYNEGCGKGVRYTFIHCAPGLVHMYEALGFRCYRRGIASTEVGQHVPMMLLTDDREGLAKLGSPFAAWARNYPETRGREAWFRERFPDYAGKRTAIHGGAIAFVGHALAGVDTSENNAAARYLLGYSAEQLKRCFRRAALIDCNAGDWLADSADGFHDLVIQLAGASSTLRLADGQAEVQARHAGTAIVEDFLRHGAAEPRRVLRCEADSRFLVVPARDLEDRQRTSAGLPDPTSTNEGAAAAGAAG